MGFRKIVDTAFAVCRKEPAKGQIPTLDETGLDVTFFDSKRCLQKHRRTRFIDASKEATSSGRPGYNRAIVGAVVLVCFEKSVANDGR